MKIASIMLHLVLSYVARVVPLSFFHILIDCTIFGKHLMKTKCVF